jgi:hypothetical protein
MSITNWNVVFDDRGHFTEPHTGSRIGLGTISVRDYIRGIHRPILTEPSVSPAGITTQGPTARYGAVLFCEKEGFDPLFEHVRLTARYDIALASTKGMSNIAFRTLIDHLSQHHIPCLVLHDLDVAGVKILSTLRRATRRYSFKNEVDVIDIGLRLADVRALGLESKSEAAARTRNSPEAVKAGLRKDEATPEEIGFLLTRRVELNALPSDRLVAFVESKLQQHGVKKVIPGAELLSETFRLFRRGKHIKEILERELADIDSSDDGAVPVDLDQRVRDMLTKNPAVPWDDAVERVASSFVPESGS